LGIKLFGYLGLGLSIEYILKTQTQMLEYFEYTVLVGAPNNGGCMGVE